MSSMVMTGGTSGFGAHTAQHLREQGNTLVLGSRGGSSGRGGAEDQEPLDLKSLESVRRFAARVEERLAGEPIAALVLNAGMVQPDATGRSADGFETTFAVNHLAHYLLVRLLLDRMGHGASIVLTTSGTHDPAINGGLAPPRHAHARLLADPALDAAAEQTSARGGQEAYTASKLCTVLTARSLAEQDLVRERQISVVAFCPGQVFGTGLAQDLPLHRRIAWRVMGTPVSAPLRRFVATLNTRAAAGSALARLALGREVPPQGRTYAALRRGALTWPDPSELARDPHAAENLWQDSAALLGLVDP